MDEKTFRQPNQIIEGRFPLHSNYRNPSLKRLLILEIAVSAYEMCERVNAVLACVDLY